MCINGVDLLERSFVEKDLDVPGGQQCVLWPRRTMFPWDDEKEYG